MRLVVIAVGRLKQGPERELAERYRKRCDEIGRKLGFRGIEIHEIAESRARDATTRVAEEGASISAAIPEKSVLVTLDEHGENVASQGFADRLGRWRDQSVASTVFVIGGADGLSRPICAARKASDRVRGCDLAAPDRSYHASGAALPGPTILAGHPYHRA